MAKKLCLVLDLDNTLLHTQSKKDSLPANHQGNSFIWDGFITKLRPFARDFLREVSVLCGLYIYTMGDRNYAMRMAQFLDPHNVYFGSGSRIFSREDCTTKRQKCLDVVPVDESMVLILDDKEKVWKRNPDNLIRVKKYKYRGDDGDRGEDQGGLISYLHVVKRIHMLYFSEMDSLYRDVRLLLGFARRDILKGCQLVLGQWATTSKTGYCKMWRFAEEMGATCSGIECCSSTSTITHVVSADANSTEAQWAMMKGRFLVSPKWITAAYYSWKRQPEDEFKVENVCCTGNNAAGLGLGKRSRFDDNESTSQGMAKRPIILKFKANQVKDSCEANDKRSRSVDDEKLTVIAQGLGKKPIRVRIIGFRNRENHGEPTADEVKINQVQDSCQCYDNDGLLHCSETGKHVDDHSTASQGFAKRPVRLRIVCKSGNASSGLPNASSRWGDVSTISQSLAERIVF